MLFISVVSERRRKRAADRWGLRVGLAKTWLGALMSVLGIILSEIGFMLLS